MRRPADREIVGRVRPTRAETVIARLADERSRRVVLLSHCLLNQNTRYLGGAFRPGAVDEVVDRFRDAGTGIHQMPCPEQQAWGGVLKRYTLPLYGAGRVRRASARLLLPLFLWHTRRVYRRLAREVAAAVEDYVRSGFEVTSVVGIAGSPSCGVCRTLDLSRSLDAIAGCPLDRLDRRVVNREAVGGAVRAGEGMFVDELRRRLRRRGIDVPFEEHDSLAAAHVPAARSAAASSPAASSASAP
jgi:predicted secreted protein